MWCIVSKKGDFHLGIHYFPPDYRPDLPEGEPMIAPLHSPSLIREAVCHPSVFPWVAAVEDPEEFVWEPSRWHFALGAWDGDEYLGCFIFEIRNPRLVEAHVALLPKAWGPRAKQAGEEAIRWVFKLTRFERIHAAVSVRNRAALAYVERVGMTPWGKAPRSSSKGDDQIFFGISKEA